MNRENILLRLYSKERNEEKFSECCRDDFMDLGVTYFYTNGNSFCGAMYLKQEQIAESEIESHELFELAKENTKRNIKFSLFRMEDVIEQIRFGTKAMNLLCEERFEKSEIDTYVASNEQGFLGASVMLYTEILERISDTLGNSLYILPSSVHELIIIPEKDGCDEEMLKNTVLEVNGTCITDNDFLSDSIYFYDSKVKKVKRIM